MLDSISVGGPPVISTKHGCDPYGRGLDDLRRSGMILVDKPQGPSSHQLAAWARDILKLNRLGHGGTLDPFATGALTLLLGNATRLTEFVLSSDKTYIAVLRIDRSVDPRKLVSVLDSLKGEVYNVPPKESAVKIRVRTRLISEIALIESEAESGSHAISVTCQAGTYIRTLARDIGLLLGCECKLEELHRDSTGVFGQRNLCTMHQLRDASLLAEQGDDSAMKKLIAPVEAFLSGKQGVWVRDSAIASVCHGAPLAVPGVFKLNTGIKSGDKVVLWSAKGEAIGIGEMSIGGDEVSGKTSGEVLRPKVVLMDKGTYPGSWTGRT